MSDERGTRRFTLRDLFALVTVCGVLLALSVPAIQAAREAARRDQCLNKLKQLGLALHSHHDVYAKFPPLSYQGNLLGNANVGVMPGSGDSETAAGFFAAPGTASGYSWIVRILPFLNEMALYNKISAASQKFTCDGWSKTAAYQIHLDGVARHFSTVPLDAVSCPSFRGSTISSACSGISRIPGTVAGYSLPTTGYAPFSRSSLLPPHGVVVTNYVALSATTSLNMPDPKTADGTLIPGKGVHVNEILDGTSHTLMLCETKEPAFNSWYDGTTAWTTATPAGTNLGSSSVGCLAIPIGGTTSLDYGPSPTSPGGTAKLYAQSSHTTAGFSGQSGSIAWGPSSDHSGGVILPLTADGRAHAISTEIDPTLYIQLVTRDGHEPTVISPDVN